MSKPVPSATLSTLLSCLTTLDPELPFRVLAYRESIPAGLAGGYVALTDAARAVQVGLLSEMLGWQALAGASGLDAVRGRQQVVEAATELVTRLARAFRGRWADGREVTIGLPLFVEGGIVLDGRLEAQAADIVLGSTRALLVVLAAPSSLAAATPTADPASATPTAHRNQEPAR